MILIILFAAIIIASVAIVQSFFGKEKSETETRNDQLDHQNELFECIRCRRYSRRWQREIHAAMHNENVCVHCGRLASHQRMADHIQDSSTRTVLVLTDNFDEWLDTHADCYKLDRLTYEKHVERLQEIAELRAEEEKLKRQEEYNARQETSYWIKKAQEDKRA